MNTQEVEILFVEDNPRDADLTIRALKKHNLANHLVHLYDGVDALDFLFAQGKYSERKVANSPRLILLDLKMPKLSGIEVLKQIKDDERTKRIPIVVLTSSKEDPDIQACYALGVNSYVVKPVSFDSFMQVITDLGLYWMIVNQGPK
jgi:two-component system response regulator